MFLLEQLSQGEHVMEQEALKKTLGPWMIWGLGVGYVISGMYFGWNLGLIEGGPYGLLIATIIVTVMYVAIVLNYAELTCAMPKAGGSFVYASKAFGPRIGFLTGIAQWIEFTFAPPAIAAAIGAYFSLFFPHASPTIVAIIVYAVFTGLNIYGVKLSAMFELVITALAVFEIFIFAGVTLPHFSIEKFSLSPMPNGYIGVLKALPFAIWFYLAIEAVANIAEESINPEKDLSRGFMLAMATLVMLTAIVFFGAIGVDGWESVVYPAGSAEPSDSPLPLAMAKVVGQGSALYHLLISIGLFGLIASFHGIILASGRALLELGRKNYVPELFGQILPNRQTPANALMFNMVVGIVALISGKTSSMITLAVFGAVTVYIISMAAHLRLRKTHPQMRRPFLAPFYPWSPILALVLALMCMCALTVFNPKIALVFVAILVVSWLATASKRNAFAITD